MKLDKENLIYRTLTAVLGIIVLLFIFYWGGYIYSLLIVAIAIAAYIEYVQISQHMGKKIPAVLGAIAGLTFLLHHIVDMSLSWGTLFVPIIVLMCFEMIVKYPRMKFDDLTMGFFGIFYIFVLISYFLNIRALENGFLWILFVMILIWVGDSAAYFVGVKWGQHKLAASLSPKKSVEGAIGSLCFTVMISILGGLFFFSFDPLSGLLFGIVVSVSGIFGDLFESALKRTANVKDSGKLLPGHGGILDRFDSALFVVPIAYFFITRFLL